MDATAMRQQLVTAFADAPRGAQSRIADALGVRVQTVNKWAKGYNLPEPDTWEQLQPLLVEMGLLTAVRSESDPSTSREGDEVMQLIADIGARLDRIEERLATLDGGPQKRRSPAPPRASAPASR